MALSQWELSEYNQHGKSALNFMLELFIALTCIILERELW